MKELDGLIAMEIFPLFSLQQSNRKETKTQRKSPKDYIMK